MSAINTEDLKKLIRETVKEAVAEALQQVNSRLDQLDTTISILRLDLDTRTRTVSLIQDENRELRAKMSELEKKIDSVEQYSKRDNLLFVGLPTNAAGVVGADAMAETSTTLTETVLKITNDILKVPITKDDISVVHRIPKKNASGNASTSPVVIRFTKRSTRDAVSNARFELKGKNIGYPLFINENLTSVNQKIFSCLHKKFKDKKIQGVWTTNCKVLCKRNNGNVLHVTSIVEANTIDS